MLFVKCVIRNKAYMFSFSFQQEAFREAMNAHSAQLTKMRLPERAVMLKAVGKAKNPMLMKRRKMFQLR